MNNYPWHNMLPHDRRSMFIDERDGLPEFNYRFNVLIDQKKSDVYNKWRMDPQALIDNINIKPYMKLLGDAMFLSKKLNVFDEHMMMPGSLLNQNHIELLNAQIEALEAIVREKEVELILHQYADVIIVRELEIKDLKKDNESLKKDVQKMRESDQAKLRVEWENHKIQNQDLQNKIQLLEGNVAKEVAKNAKLLIEFTTEKNARQNLESKIRNEHIPWGHDGIKRRILDLKKEYNAKINMQANPAKELLKQENLHQEKEYLKQQNISLRQEKENLMRALSAEQLSSAALKKNIGKECEAKEAIKKELSKERFKNQILEKEIRNQRMEIETARINALSLTRSKSVITQPTGPFNRTHFTGTNVMPLAITSTALPKYYTNYMYKGNSSTVSNILAAKTTTIRPTFQTTNTGRGWTATSKRTGFGAATQPMRRSLSNPNFRRRKYF